jgi:hypothetical protein
VAIFKARAGQKTRNFPTTPVFNQQLDMKDQPTSEELRELLWRRSLTTAERARLAAPSVSSAELELEARLTATLEQLPTVPVSSNFTARVLQAIDRDEARSEASVRRWSWTRWLPRVTVSTAMLALAAVTWQQHELTARRTAIAHSVAQIATSAALPGVDALANYDAIKRMGQAQPADDALLALMQ